MLPDAVKCVWQKNAAVLYAPPWRKKTICTLQNVKIFKKFKYNDRN